MRLNRFFVDRKNLRESSSVKLEDSDINHIKKVLRLGKGDKIILFNGEKEFLAELKIVSSEVVMAKIVEILKDTRGDSKKTEIALFQSLLRAGKFDFIIEKATELGIDYIIPVEAEFSQSKLDVAVRKIDRWQKVATASAKQSERIGIPQFQEPIKFARIKEYLNDFDLVLFLTIPRKNIPSSQESINLKEIQDSFKDAKRIAYIIGPEGGFSPTEHKIASEWGLKFVKYGDTVLRSETAAVAILSVLRYILN